jgi:hypothetical protein
VRLVDNRKVPSDSARLVAVTMTSASFCVSSGSDAGSGGASTPTGIVGNTSPGGTVAVSAASRVSGTICCAAGVSPVTSVSGDVAASDCCAKAGPATASIEAASIMDTHVDSALFRDCSPMLLLLVA